MLEAVEEKLVIALPGNLEIELHYFGWDKYLIDFETALELIYLDENTFFFIIDIGMKDTNSSNIRFFVRPSGHPTVPFERTSNFHLGTGPFKIIGEMVGLSGKDLANMTLPNTPN